MTTVAALPSPQVESFFHAPTNTFTHVVYDQRGGHAAIIDPVMDFDPASGRTGYTSVQAVIDFIADQQLTVQWILETHAHADHLSSAGYLHERYGAPVAIGAGIVAVQQRFKALFGLGDEFIADGRQFDRLFNDGDTFQVGQLPARVIATPGHTDDSLTYVIGDAAFIGDTLFAPDTGSARADFPGGDAGRLYDSIQRLLGLPASTRLFLCHDYPPEGREEDPVTDVAEQASANVHVGGGRSRQEYVQLRQTRDAHLPVPKLLLPSLQVNIRGGRLPAADANGIAYLRLPLNALGGAQ